MVPGCPLASQGEVSVEGRGPLEMLRTEAGARLVEEMHAQLDTDLPREHCSMILWRVSTPASLILRCGPQDKSPLLWVM